MTTSRGPIPTVMTFISFSHAFGFCARRTHWCVILPKSTYPFHPAHARCGGLSFRRFTDLRTASVPDFHPAETIMTYLTQSGSCCFFFKSTERVDERNIKAPTDTSMCRPTTSEDACHAAHLPGQSLQMCEFSWCFWKCVNLQHFVTEWDIATSFQKSCDFQPDFLISTWFQEISRFPVICRFLRIF